MFCESGGLATLGVLSMTVPCSVCTSRSSRFASNVCCCDSDVLQSTSYEEKTQNGKGTFLYSTVSGLSDRSKHFTLQSLTHMFIPTPTQLLWDPLSHAAITHEGYSLTFPPLSIARYSFIQLSPPRRQWRERKY